MLQFLGQIGKGNLEVLLQNYTYFDIEDGFREDVRRNISWQAILDNLGIAYKTRSTGVIVSLSPFTNERTPSSFYRPETGHFHTLWMCYSSGKSGDKVDFVTQYNDWDRLEYKPISQWCKPPFHSLILLDQFFSSVPRIDQINPNQLKLGL